MLAQRTARRAFTLIELLVVIVIIAVLMGLLLAAVQSVRSNAYRLECSNNVRQLVIAVRSFETNFKSLPGNKAQLPGRFSMHVELLPNIEQQPRYDLIDFKVDRPTIKNIFPATKSFEYETSHSKHIDAFNHFVESFNCPSDFIGVSGGVNYVPIVSPDGGKNAGGVHLRAWMCDDNETTFPLPKDRPTAILNRLVKTRMQAIRDGSGQTMMITERIKGLLGAGQTSNLGQSVQGSRDSSFVVDQFGTVTTDNGVMVDACRSPGATPTTTADASGAQWFQHTCRWLGCANLAAPPNTVPCTGTTSNANLGSHGAAPPSSYHAGGANCGFFDGSVSFVSANTDLKVLHGLGTIDGQETASYTP